MRKLTPDEIAHLTQGTYPHDQTSCPHDHIVTVEPAGTLFICLDCGMEHMTLEDFERSEPFI
jgi:6-phosphogluconolactonase (cycloisomerase 2 family)